MNVIPRRDVLDGKGCIWEWLLAEKGWNSLPQEQKSGTVSAAYTDGTVDVFFPALSYTAKAVFPDELRTL